MNSLPKGIIDHIASYIPPEEIGKIKLINKALLSKHHEKYCWRKFEHLLRCCPQITTLHIHKKITDKELTVLTSKSIWSLDLKGCDKITDASLEIIVSLSKLTKLNLSGCHNITQKLFNKDSLLSRLTHLDLSGKNGIAPDKIKGLATCSSVRSLNLNSTTFFWKRAPLPSSRISELMDTVGKLTTLVSLNLCGILIQDVDLEKLYSLSKLEEVDLSKNPKITWTGIKELQRRLPNLRVRK